MSPRLPRSWSTPRPDHHRSRDRSATAAAEAEHHYRGLMAVLERAIRTGVNPTDAVEVRLSLQKAYPRLSSIAQQLTNEEYFTVKQIAAAFEKSEGHIFRVIHSLEIKPAFEGYGRQGAMFTLADAIRLGDKLGVPSPVEYLRRHAREGDDEDDLGEQVV